MNNREFLETVLPEEDNYVLCIAFGEKVYNRNFQSVDDMVAAMTKVDRGADTVYYAVGKFKDNTEVVDGRPKVRRKQHMATLFKTLCADIDVGPQKRYTTQQEAVKAVALACKAAALPCPMVVLSGTGVHVYWPLDQAVKAATWETLSIALRGALQAHDVVVDTSKIHDASMVLRPPGTHHKKDPDNWREVRVARPAGPMSVVELAKALAPYKGVAPASRSKKPRSSVASAIMGEPSPIVLGDMVRCPQLAALLQTGGAEAAQEAEVEEPLWRLSLGIAKYCDAPEHAVERLCGGHPEYDLEENLRKMEGWAGTGPATCAAFESANPAGCEGCPHRGKITSPAQLTRGEEVVTAEPSIPSESLFEGTGVEITAPLQSIPLKGYHFKNGWLLYTPPGEDAEEQPVCPYNLFVVGSVSNVDEDKQAVKLAVDYPLEGWRVVEIPTQAVAKGGVELGAALSMKRIYLTGDVGRLRQYIMTYLSELQKHKPVEYYYSHFGWQKDGSFLGPTGLLNTPDDRDPHYEGPITQYTQYLHTKGSLDAWAKATKLFAEPSLTHHGLVFLMMAGAFLFEAAGPPSLLVNAYSRDSGSGKTLVGFFGNSLWGDPASLMRTVNDTENALYKHFGIMHSLGAFVDEITTMDEHRLRSLVFTLPEGREKARVKQTADGFRDIATWRMPVFSSSNRDIHDALNIRYSSEAERLRVLQFPMDRVPLFEGKDKRGYAFYRHLTQNYGTAGPALVEAVIEAGGVQQVYDRAYERFEHKYGFSFYGQERFYMAAFVAADAIGEIGREMGIFYFDCDALVQRGLTVVEQFRERNAADTLAGVDLVAQYCLEHAREFVNLRVSYTQDGQERDFIDAPQHRSAVGRKEIERDQTGRFRAGMLYLNAPLFKRWCRENGAEFRSVVHDMRDAGITVKEGTRKALYAGVTDSGAVGVVYCVAIDIGTHPQLIEAMDGGRGTDGKPRLAAV